MKRVVLLALSLAVAIIATVIGVKLCPAFRWERGDTPVVGAFYYLWYGRPGQWQQGHSYIPILGEYNSKDPKVIAQHVRWAKSAGIDFFLTSWNPRDEDFWNTHVKDAFTFYLAQRDVLPSAILYEAELALGPYPGQPYDFNSDPDGDGKTMGQQFVEDMQRLITYGWVRSPNYYKINGRPVIYLWTFFLWRNWGPYLDQVVANFRAAGVFPPYFIGHITAWDSPISPGFDWGEAMGRIQAVSSLLMYVNDDRLDAYYNVIHKQWWYWRNVADSYGIRFIPGISPGYDDRPVRGLDRRILDREQGNTLRKHCLMAKRVISRELPMVIVATFNDWHEATQIEPAMEYGTLYLELNRACKEGL